MKNVRIQILLLILIVLVVYFPAVSAEVTQVDDLSMLRSLGSGDAWNLKALFLPMKSGGLYYRPLIGLTFIFDKMVWHLTSGIMHLENIFLHIFNSIAVLFLARSLQSSDEKKTNVLPFVSALFFAIHPVNVESVAWISGRTDVLACLFVLIAAQCLILFTRKPNAWLLLILLIAFTSAVLTKESAIGFVVGAFYILLIVKSDISHNIECNSKLVNVAKAASVILLIVIFILFYKYVTILTASKSNIGMTIGYIKVNPMYSLMLIMRSLTFYIAKIIWPFPLNFTITDVDPLYELLALPLLGMIIYVLFKRTLSSALWITGTGLIAPSLIIIFGSIAWTPYAERYVYMGSAFIIPAMFNTLYNYATYTYKIYHKNIVYNVNVRPAIYIATLLILSFYSINSYQRNIVWQTNISLYRDTAEKNPDYNEARNLYGVSLFRIGDLIGAESELAIAKSLYSFEYFEKFDLNYCVVLARLGRYNEIVTICEKVLVKTKGRSVNALELLIDARHNLLKITKDAGTNYMIRKKMIENYKSYAALTSSPYDLFYMGKIALVTSSPNEARMFFQKAYKGFSANDPYKGIVETYLARLDL